MIAKKIGQQTTFPSLELATEDLTSLVGACDSGFSCTYINTLCWATPTTPLPMEINPRVVFERMFGDPGSKNQRLARISEDKSILDSIASEESRLRRELGARDRLRIADTWRTSAKSNAASRPRRISRRSRRWISPTAPRACRIPTRNTSA